MYNFFLNYFTGQAHEVIDFIRLLIKKKQGVLCVKSLTNKSCSSELFANYESNLHKITNSRFADSMYSS